MTFPKADLVQKYTGTRFIPPASPAVHRRESGRGFTMPHCRVPHAMPQLESDDKQNPRPLSSVALPLPCGGPWRDIAGCLCKKLCISAICSRQSESVPAEAQVLVRCLTQPLALQDLAMPWPELQGRPWSMQAELHRATGAGTTKVRRQCQRGHQHRTSSTANAPAPPTHPAKALTTTQTRAIHPTETEIP